MYQQQSTNKTSSSSSTIRIISSTTNNQSTFINNTHSATLDIFVDCIEQQVVVVVVVITRTADYPSSSSCVLICPYNYLHHVRVSSCVCVSNQLIANNLPKDTISIATIDTIWKNVQYIMQI
jgi:hypothetical protein